MSPPPRPGDPLATVAANFSHASVTASLPAAIGDWVIDRRIGAGAMGEVFLAIRGKEFSALKLVAKRYAGDDAFTQRFHREIAVLAKLDHPGVARALDWGELDGRPWLAMEFIDGPNLETLLAGHGPFFESDVLRLAIQLARGLEHIHQRAGLIHRDVKPANILIARVLGADQNRLLNTGDAAKIIDFGLAKPTEDQEGLGLTMTGMIMGTPNYIAPEQVACERNLTLHVDMYALGATVFHLLTGKVPFQAGSAAAVMAAHLNQPPPDPGQTVPALSPLTRKLVLTTLGKRAVDRFTDWNAFVIACEKALAALGENQAAGTNRFLKKPMLKPATTVVRREAPAPSSNDPVLLPVESEAQPQTNRATTKLMSTVAIPPPGPGAAALAELASARAAESSSYAAGAELGSDGSSALRAAVTTKIAKTRTTKRVERSTTEHRGVQTSAVQKWSGRLDTAGTTGGAWLPWVALTAAAAAAVAGAIWVIFQR